VELPRYLLVSLLTIVTVYWLMGFEGNFFAYILVVFVLSAASASYAVVLGSVVSDPKQGQELAPLILVPQLLFTGLFVPISTIPKWLRWIQYICVLKYGVNLGTLVEFGDCSSFRNSTRLECEALLDNNDISLDNIDRDIIVPVAIFLLCRGLSLAGLVFRAQHYTN